MNSAVPSPELLPRLLAELADDGARDYLMGVALAGGVAELALLTVPVGMRPHLLEVYTPGHRTALVFHARPVGPPTANGFPLRLTPGPNTEEAFRGQPPTAPKVGVHRNVAPIPKPNGGGPPAAIEVPDCPRPPSLRPQRELPHELTARHTRDLTIHDGVQEIRQDLIGRTLASGKLCIEAQVGTGGAGDVFRARHRDLQMLVALKVLHERFQGDVDFCRRFYGEALTASRLDHPNLTRIIDFGQEPDGLLYLAMEFLDGAELRRVLDMEKRLTTERIVTIMMQVCAGLTHAHMRGVVHRDIKPENIVIVSAVDDDGNTIELVKVCDFGIAQTGMPDPAARIAGTPEYMSPEQCDGAELDARSDVYSCGIVLYELATGDVPFIGREVAHIVSRQKRTPPEPPSRRAPDIHPNLEKVILRALEKNPAQRWQSMRELRAALRGVVDVSAPYATGGYRAYRSLEMNAVVAALRPTPPDLPPSDPRPPKAIEPGAGYADFFERMPASTRMPAVQVPSGPEALATVLARDPRAFLVKLAQTTNVVAFRTAVAPLDGVLRVLSERREAETLFKFLSTLDHIARDEPAAPGSRAEAAATLVRLISDPQMLAPIAEVALERDDGPGAAARRLLVRAGLGGAYALYSARTKNQTPEARTRFVATLREMGTIALPVFRAALERLESRLTMPGAIDAAQDLLEALPTASDEGIGNVVARYAGLLAPALARPATRALPRFWGQRARALLLGLLEHPDQGVRADAIAGLSELRAVDEHAVRRLDPILRGMVAADVTLRLAAARALAAAVPEARASAEMLLEHALRALALGAGKGIASSEPLAIGMAEAFVALGAQRARNVIAELARGSPRLRAALEGPSSRR